MKTILEAMKNLREKKTITDKYDLEDCIKKHIKEMYYNSILYDIKSDFVEYDDMSFYKLKFSISEDNYKYNPITANTIKKWIKEDFDIDLKDLEVSVTKQGWYGSKNREYSIKYYVSREQALKESTIWNEQSVKRLEKGIEQIKKEIPDVKFSKVTDSKFSGPRARITIGPKKTNIFIDDNMFIIGDKYQSYTGTLKEVIRYIKDYMKTYGNTNKE